MPAVDEYPPALIYGSQTLDPVGHRMRNLHLGDHVDASSTVKDEVELRSAEGGGVNGYGCITTASLTQLEHIICVPFNEEFIIRQSLQHL